MDIIKKISEEIGCRTSQTEAAVKLIDEGNTIPFIARYRKEATGALNDEQLRALHERLTYLRNLEDKKAQVIASIEEQGKLTPELRAEIESAETMVLVDDLYRPYRPKRKTRATVAKDKGLEGLANIISLQMRLKSMCQLKRAWRPWTMPSPEPWTSSPKTYLIQQTTEQRSVTSQLKKVLSTRPLQTEWWQMQQIIP